MITTSAIPETSRTQEESVEFDMATMNLNAPLAAYLAKPGDQKALIPLSRLSTSARNVLLKVRQRAQGEVTHPEDEFRLEALEEITVQHLKDARNVGSTRANDFLSELNSIITKMNMPPVPCKKDPVEVIEFSESILDFEYINLDLEKVLFNQKRLGERSQEILRSKEELDEATKRRLKREKSIGVKSDHLLWASKQPLVINCAKYYSGKSISFSELIKQGKLGLSVALRKFDQKSPHSFSTYATWWIRQAMQIMLEEKADTGSVEALETGKAENTNLMGTLILQIESLLNFCSSREINVLALRIGLFDGTPKALDDIAQIYGESRERIRQIESKFVSKIRYYLKESPCPSCGEIITASSHEEILKRIPAAVELAELILKSNNLSDYIEKLAFEDSDFYIAPECLSYLFRIIDPWKSSIAEISSKIDSTISSW